LKSFLNTLIGNIAQSPQMTPRSFLRWFSWWHHRVREIRTAQDTPLQKLPVYHITSTRWLLHTHSVVCKRENHRQSRFQIIVFSHGTSIAVIFTV